MSLKKYLKSCLDKKGQSTLEYVIILAVVVGAIVAVGIIFKPDLTRAYNMIYPDAPTPPKTPQTGITGATGTGTRHMML